MWYGSSWLSISTLRTYDWDGPNLYAVLCELLNSFHSTAAVMASSLDDVCSDCEWSACTVAVGVTVQVSWRPCYSGWNILAPGWCQLEECNMNLHTSLPDRLLQARSIEIMLRHLSSVYSMIIEHPAVHCVSWVHLTTHFIVMSNNTAENSVTQFDGSMYHKNKHLIFNQDSTLWRACVQILFHSV